MSLKNQENKAKLDREPRSAEQTLADLASIAFTEAGDPAAALVKMRGILDGSLRVSTLDPWGLVVTLRNEAPAAPSFFERVQHALRVLEVAEEGVRRWYEESAGYDNGNWLASDLRNVLSGGFSVVVKDVPHSLPDHPLDVPPDSPPSEPSDPPLFVQEQDLAWGEPGDSAGSEVSGPDGWKGRVV
jgi:hypothetical protein